MFQMLENFIKYLRALQSKIRNNCKRFKFLLEQF